MKKHLFLPLFALLLASCTNDTPFSKGQNEQTAAPLTLLKSENSAYQYENLRLYPVIAATATESANAALKNLKTLAEAMQKPGFRVLEQKQFGRSDQPWYHGLTVQNKTQDTVLLLSGDVVKGGNQDRVIAHHEVILPMSVRNIEVFCVEAGRSSYYNPAASAAEKEAAAFNGYYSVASPKVRRAVQNTGNQQEVWDAVAKVTQANQAESATKAYTALDNAGASKKRRDAYLEHLGQSFAHTPEVVGVVAVCGDQILGIDIFGDADLFRRQYAGLLHGYVAEAAVASPSTPLNETEIQQSFDQAVRLCGPIAKGDEKLGKFALGGAWVHIFGK